MQAALINLKKLKAANNEDFLREVALGLAKNQGKIANKKIPDNENEYKKITKQ